MKYKRSVRRILCSSLLVFLGQFLLFRTPPIYNLCLKSYLYDNASWIEERPRILLMGSSRCFHQLVPSVIAEMNGLKETDTANIGQAAAGPFEMLTTYRKHIEKFRDVELVFYVLDHEFFFESSHIEKPYERILLSRRQWELIADEHGNFYHLPIVLFANALRGSPRKGGANMGFEGLPHFDFLNMHFEDRSARYRKDIENFPLSDFQMKSIMEIRKICESGGGELVFVLTPYWDTEKLGDDFFERARIVMRALDESIGPVRLAGGWEKAPYDLEDEDVLSNSHLTTSGAKKFTEAVFGDIETIRSSRPVLLMEAVFGELARSSEHENQKKTFEKEIEL